jgi:hypothetical protein
VDDVTDGLSPRYALLATAGALGLLRPLIRVSQRDGVPTFGVRGNARDLARSVGVVESDRA